MNIKICPVCKRPYFSKRNISKICKKTFPKIKKGCKNLLDLISFVFIICIVFGFVTFCQKKEEHSNFHEFDTFKKLGLEEIAKK